MGVIADRAFNKNGVFKTLPTSKRKNKNQQQEYRNNIIQLELFSVFDQPATLDVQ